MKEFDNDEEFLFDMEPNNSENELKNDNNFTEDKSLNTTDSIFDLSPNTMNSSNSIFVHEYTVSNDDYKYKSDKIEDYNKENERISLNDLNPSKLSKEEKDKYLHINGTDFDRSLGIDNTDYNSEEEKAKYEEFYKKYQNDKESSSDKESNNKNIEEKANNFKFNLKSVFFIGALVFFILAIFIAIFTLNATEETEEVKTSCVMGEYEEQVDFITRVIATSGSTSKNNYDKLKSISKIKNEKNASTYDEQILTIRNSFSSYLDEVNTIDGTCVDSLKFKNEINLLRQRYQNALSLCDEMIFKDESLESVYNSYATKEIEIGNNLNKEIMKNLDELGVTYQYENGKIIIED